MLYRVICEKPVDDVAIISIRQDILSQKGVFISTGNAASTASEILSFSEHREILIEIRDSVSKVWWTEESGSKRKIMAECLIPDIVPPEFIQAIYVVSHDAVNRVKETLQQSDFQIIPEPNLFFQPFRKSDLNEYLSVVEGDLFFSRMQTLTVSVNTVGIMGKGLASRAKYQFPDVYVFYQDLCRKKILRMGKPYLYKREVSFDYQLADEPATLTNGNLETWFLLFPTKEHWKNRADINSIEKGLQWLEGNYKKEGIKSLAIPALGCGLGWLEWKEVGPLLCKYLSAFDIQVWVYLPTEKRVPDELTTKEFLLR
jgi:O-acetyl-ADP-ribose deacetylase (regulator of RNase III)